MYALLLFTFSSIISYEQESIPWNCSSMVLQLHIMLELAFIDGNLNIAAKICGYDF